MSLLEITGWGTAKKINGKRNVLQTDLVYQQENPVVMQIIF